MIFTFAFKKDELNPTIKDKIITKSISLWTKSEYFHCEFFYDNIWYGINTSGVERYKLRPLNHKFYDYIEIDVDVTPLQLELLEFFINKEFLYDWSGIFLSQFIPIGFNREDKWFCSEYLIKVLQILLIKDFILLQPELYSPEDLFHLLAEYKKKQEVKR